jgi:Family of unknown function (DUF6328)
VTTTEASDTAADEDARRDRNETEKERLDRNMIELLNELRVALPGVQVLFAFLLAVPFNQRFGQVTEFQKDVYFGTLLCTAMTTGLLLAPSTLHRIQFRQDDKKHIVMASNRYAIAGFFFLMLSVIGAVLLVTDFLFGTTTTIVATAFIAGFLVLFWYLLPLARRAG